MDVTNPSIADDAPETLTVGFEDDGTRIQLNEAQKTVWTKGDRVSVFYKSDGNDCWQFTGNTGDRSGSLKRISVGDYSRRGDYAIVVYPYNPDYLISLASNTIEASLPAVQEYTAGSYGVGSSPMVAMGDYKQFSLKSVCGWLKLQLTGGGQYVRSITLRGNNGEQVAGDILIVAEDASVVLAEASVDVNDDEVGGTLLGDGDVLREVTLECINGAMIGSEVTEFYIALPPQTFENGLSIDVECYGYEPTTITTSNAVTIERNHIQPMAAVNVDVSTLEVNKALLPWTGTWSVNSHEVFGGDINDWSNDTTTYEAKEETFTVTISPCTTRPYDVVIDGLSVLGEGWNTYGNIDGDSLHIMCGAIVDRKYGYDYQWVGYYNVDGNMLFYNYTTWPACVVSMCGINNKAVSTNEVTIYDNDGMPKSAECIICDVFGVTDSGGLYLIGESDGNFVYRTGDMEWKKESNLDGEKVSDIDITVRVGSVVDITGNPDYEEDYPSDSTVCIYMEANADELESIKYYVDDSRRVPAGMSSGEIIALYGNDASYCINEMYGVGYSFLVFPGMTPGTTIDVFLGFTTVYGDTLYYHTQYTPGGEN